LEVVRAFGYGKEMKWVASCGCLVVSWIREEKRGDESEV